MARKLRSGYTTGACAAAATLGAARMLHEQCVLEQVQLELPSGDLVTFRLHGQRFDRELAECFVIKDAGDDPDITNGVEVHAAVSLNRSQPAAADGAEGELAIVGGTGIGRITKPGLAVPVGEWAINPVPRQMIAAAVRSVFANRSIQVTLTIPDGEKRAEKTLNARLGIVGGLSLLGTTGIVRPISHKAWTDTLEVALDVAQAVGCDSPVFATGRSSEDAAQTLLGFEEEAYVMMGDHVCYAVQAARRKGFKQVLLAAQFAKLVKIACGHPQTHVHSSRLDLEQLAAWVETAAEKVFIRQANTAREVFMHYGSGHPLIARTAEHALAQLSGWADELKIGIILVGYDKQVAGTFGVLPSQRNG